MRNMYHILRQAVMVLSVLFLVTSSGETLAQNGWQQQIQNAQKAQLADEVTEDGRALGKFQNRIFAVPAARLGITPRETSTSPAALATSWSPQKQSAINADIEKLASGASSGSGTAAKGEPVKVASVPTQSRTDATRAARSGGQEPPATKDLTPKSDGGSGAAKGGEQLANEIDILRDTASDGKTLISQDGLGQFRPPSAKPNSPHATTGTQAKFEQRRVPEGRWQSNGHLDITP